ncbi:MAG: hypothetical protein A2568_02055 [Candidatus Yanofskybacteria bacterium RIFOXYD1_FULL_44_17]|nr:MAG: hypothetical protein A2241_00690 [Candidatus Yanofskybacteria bacterium RIFOXYA2_FULL_45_28]OGN36961.1 MAG: hypothetical protein A2207_01340 [Candidatus Yanofskybacteria bacterium RIFOXYA1_FULL_44_17]OGN38403.1 MAG: hypothetical protein A2405_01605 [Candidatus Yanofskybacteria bacterium RIFOXYC1_FULL_44_16]OGN38582.1 MAG: hypothetical protein A2302_00735 [Candidatus Yanofskybacteria bacterium RIFOXYB2_FULL_44_18]OGN38762.1 MAG: hypothetical protein A2371_03410 [Candidatus Yanofskybacter
MPDAPEPLGKLFLQAARDRNIALLNSVFGRCLMWGKYMRQLPIQDQKWVSKHAGRTRESGVTA